MRLAKDQKGVSLIAAIFIIVILAFMGVVFLTLFTATSSTSINELQSTRAFYVAEGGLERGIRYLLSPTLTERIACASIPSTNTLLGVGEFSLSIEAGSPFYSTAATALSSNITSTDTTINVSSTANYAPFGRIIIDREIINYTGTTATSFTGALRGRDGTIATSHTSGARVGQYQCTTTSTGGVPDLTNSTAQRVVSEGIQLEEGWAVGNVDGSGEVITRWNSVAWQRWPVSASIPDVNFNSVSMLSYSDGWAVGNRSGNNFNFLRWDGSQWVSTQVNSGLRANLNSVFMVSSRDGWAVGDERSNNLTFLQWDGTNWNVQSFTTSNTERDLNSVYMWDSDNDGLSDDGWAVGDCCDDSGRAWILRYQGGSWDESDKIPAPAEASENLNSVFMVSQSEVWMVGDDRGGGPNALIFRWRNGAWTYTDPGVDRDLNSIFMFDTDADGDADDGWAVGANGTILRWNGANWSSVASPTNQELESVFMLSQINGFASGNGGVIIHWDGSSWTTVASGVGQRLNGFSLIGPKQRPQAMWREVYK